VKFSFHSCEKIKSIRTKQQNIQPALFILFFSVSVASGRRPVFCRFQPTVLKMGAKSQPLRVSIPLHLTPDPSPEVEGRKDKGVETHRGTGLEAGNN
jgi:hypothetical protein